MTTTGPGGGLGAGRRLVFLDLARALAVLFMIQGHTMNVFLAPEHQSGVLYDVWLFLRGLTSCAFLLLAGFTFSLATANRLTSYTRVSRRLWRRIFRFGSFIAFGYLMRFPAVHLRDLAYVSDLHWRQFLVVDVLQCVGLVLIVLQIVLLATRRFERFGFVMAVMGTVVVLLTPTIWSAARTHDLPVAVAAYLSDATGSLFPLFPWSGYMLAGASLGSLYVVSWREQPVTRFVGRVLVPLGAILVIAGLLLHQIPLSPLGPLDFWRLSPNIFLIRTGCVVLIVAALAMASTPVRRLPLVLDGLAHESLLVYVGHIVVLYGSAWNVGLRDTVERPLGPAGTALWIGLMLTSMGLLGAGWHWCKRTRPRAATVIRLGTAAALVVPLL